MVESPPDTARTAYKPREHKFKCSGSQVLRWHCNQSHLSDLLLQTALLDQDIVAVLTGSNGEQQGDLGSGQQGELSNNTRYFFK